MHSMFMFLGQYFLVYFVRVRELELAEKYAGLEKKLRELTEKDGKLV